MTRLDLDLGELGHDGTEFANPNLTKHERYLEHLTQAAGSPRGISLTFATADDARNYRFRLYRARQAVERSGITSFSKMTITVKGPQVFIRPDMPPRIDEL